MSAERCAGDARSHTYDSTGTCERCGKLKAPNALPTPEQLDWVEIPGHPGSYLPRAEYEQATRPQTTHQRAIAEYEQLVEAAERQTPACAGDDRFITDGLPLADRIDIMRICAEECRIRRACAAYADKARPLGGYWDGKSWTAPPPREEHENA